MNLLEDAIASLGVPGSVAVALVLIFAVLQLIGECIEITGKVAPAILNIRKWLLRRHHKKIQQELDTANTLKQVQELLEHVHKHYDGDNIAKRDEWMQWVNSRAVVYDAKIEELVELKESLNSIANSLTENTKTTDEMFKESCRDRIINFASKVTNPLTLVSHEEFRRIFKVYDAYEAFLAAHNEPNGEVETNYALIREAYADRVRSNNFIENLRNMQH